MGRIVAIDYGQKRTGLAVTDELKIFATGLTTVGSFEVQLLVDFGIVTRIHLLRLSDSNNISSKLDTAMM
jgi:putative Holliday junction resolvase